MHFHVNRWEVEDAEESTNVTDRRKELAAQGNIKVEFQFITNIRESYHTPESGHSSMLLNLDAVQETALKGNALSPATFLSHRRAASTFPHMLRLKHL